MNTYSRTKTNYRKIWKDHFGNIPKDDQGRSFEIHHVDGNCSNNDIGNLRCLSIQEHYDLHYSQEDYFSCQLIAIRMGKRPDEISEIAKQTNKKKIQSGLHHFLGGEIQRTRVEQGTHNFITDNPVYKQVNLGKNKLIGSENNRKRMENGTHPTQIKQECVHCGKIIGLGAYARFHGENCKFNFSPCEQS